MPALPALIYASFIIVKVEAVALAPPAFSVTVIDDVASVGLIMLKTLFAAVVVTVVIPSIAEPPASIPNTAFATPVELIAI